MSNASAQEAAALFSFCRVSRLLSQLEGIPFPPLSDTLRPAGAGGRPLLSLRSAAKPPTKRKALPIAKQAERTSTSRRKFTFSYLGPGLWLASYLISF
jgi:hypothetical protein